MRNLAALLLLLFAAACSDGITVEPSSVSVAVGQTATLHVTRIPSTYPGIPWPPNPIDFSGNGAASAVGHLGANATSAEITVQGLTPGIGTVVSRHTDAHTPGVLVETVATVTVYDCSRGPQLTPQFATVSGTVNERVVLQVHSTFDGGSYQWYSGARGDVRNPISFTNAPVYVDFTPRQNGSYPFWVRQTAPCGIADAAFVVNVGPQRRRAAGR
jgi:hypothetical protein